MIDRELMLDMLKRMAADPQDRLPVRGLSTDEDRACKLLEDDELCAWVGHYPHGYRITAKGYEELAH